MMRDTRGTRRRTLLTSQEALQKLKIIQGKIKMRNGTEPSLTILVDQIIKTPEFEEIERKIVEGNQPPNIRFKMDKKLR